jgi:hypothetical protein
LKGKSQYHLHSTVLLVCPLVCLLVCLLVLLCVSPELGALGMRLCLCPAQSPHSFLAAPPRRERRRASRPPLSPRVEPCPPPPFAGPVRCPAAPLPEYAPMPPRTPIPALDSCSCARSDRCSYAPPPTHSLATMAFASRVARAPS